MKTLISSSEKNPEIVFCFSPIEIEEFVEMNIKNLDSLKIQFEEKEMSDVQFISAISFSMKILNNIVECHKKTSIASEDVLKNIEKISEEIDMILGEIIAYSNGMAIIVKEKMPFTKQKIMHLN